MADPPPSFKELSFIHRPSRLAAIVARTELLGFDMASQPRTGALLRTLAASKPRGRLLELGTGTGIATAWLLAGMDPDSTLTSVDTDPHVQEVAREFLGEDRRLKVVLEDGLEFLRKESAESYDLVFADAMPGKYDGLHECLRVVKPGGFYVVDDMLPQSNWPDGHADKVLRLIQALADEDGLAVVPIAWASGIVIAVKHAVTPPRP
jgi:predicted O-methyltransferase YrrM